MNSEQGQPLRWGFGDDIAILRGVLEASGVLAIPTESSYGFGVDPRDSRAVEAVYQIKRREARKPLPMIVADEQQAVDLGLDSSHPAFQYALRFWPAPLTVLVPYSSRIGRPLALGDLECVAVRIPDHQLLRNLLKDVGHGLTATSANLAGEPALLEGESVADLLDSCSPVPTAVVGGEVLSGGLPSTVVAWSDGCLRVLRQGRFQV